MKTAQTHTSAPPAAADTATPAAGPFRTAPVVTIAFGHFIHDIFTSFLAPLLPTLNEKLNLSLAQAGSLTSFMQLPALINPFLGNLADRVNLRWPIIIAPTITATAMCLTGLAQSYLALAALLLMVGVGSAIWHVPAPVMVARASGHKVGRGMSFFMLGGEMARTLGPILAVTVVAYWEPLGWGLEWGLEGMYRLIPVGIAASVVLYLRTRDVAAALPPARSGGLQREAWRDLARLMAPLAGIMIARGLMTTSLTAFLPTLLASEGAELWEGGAALAVLESAGAMGALTSGTISDRMGRYRVLTFVMATAPVLMLAFLEAQGWVVLPALVVLGFVALSPNPVLMALVQEHGRDHPATANGLYMAISFVARSVIVVVVGAAGDQWGLRTAFRVSALVGFAGLPFVWLLSKAAGQSRTGKH